MNYINIFYNIKLTQKGRYGAERETTETVQNGYGLDADIRGKCQKVYNDRAGA